MERLKYTELLCLRVSEGLGTERDFARLRKAGIDPSEWLDLPKMVQEAILPKSVPDIAHEVCRVLDIETLPLKSALAPQAYPDIQKDIAQTLELPEIEIPVAPVLVEEEVQESLSEESPLLQVEEDSEESEEFMVLSIDQKVEDPEQELPKLESESFTEVLAPTDVPDMLDSIMQKVLKAHESPEEPLLTLLDEDSDDDVFVLHTETIVEEPEIEASELEEAEVLPIKEALTPQEFPNILDAVMETVHEIGVPQSHLRLVSEAPEEKSTVYHERIGDVDVEIQDISSPRIIDGDSAAGNGSFWLLFVAAAAVAIFVVNQFISQSKYQPIENPEVAQSIEILELDTNLKQIHVDDTTTIIFIDAGE